MVSPMRTSPRTPHRRRAAFAAALAVAIPAAPAAACVDLGVYQDAPATAFPALRSNVGLGLNTVSVYITAGKGLSPAVAKLVQTRKLKLLVTWAPDNGTETPDQPGFSNLDVIRGTFDPKLRDLAVTLAALEVPVTMRLMPEPNAPWYAWSGNVSGNTPATYVGAFQHAVGVIRKATRGKVKVMWAPYARSVPDTPANALATYYPGARWIDAAGASGHNFGATPGSSAWKDPAATFSSAYTQIQTLGAKPFWISETGSTGQGGDKGAWMTALGALEGTAMPQLKGIVWYDQVDPLGDFRIRSGLPETLAFRGLATTHGCKPVPVKKPVVKKKKTPKRSKVTTKGRTR